MICVKFLIYKLKGRKPLGRSSVDGGVILKGCNYSDMIQPDKGKIEWLIRLKAIMNLLLQ
jgi:hypothetical protein